MWTLVFHRHCWFYVISPILIAIIGLGLFLIFFVTASGRAAALLVDFVGLIFDGILTAKACLNCAISALKTSLPPGLISAKY